MKGRAMAIFAAVAGILGGAAAIGGGLSAHATQPVFGIPQFFGLYSDLLSGVHVLVGLGVIMVIGGLVSIKWPSVGAIVVCAAAMVGLIYTYDRGPYRWTPLLYYWGAPWLFAWLAGIFAGYSVFQRVEQVGEGPAAARPAESASA
jgi:hypothetical protein